MIKNNSLVCGRFECDSSDFALGCIYNEVVWYDSLREAKGKNEYECQGLYHRRQQ